MEGDKVIKEQTANIKAKKEILTQINAKLEKAQELGEKMVRKVVKYKEL